jgi:hypothetical protein
MPSGCEFQNDNEIGDVDERTFFNKWTRERRTNKKASSYLLGKGRARKPPPTVIRLCLPCCDALSDFATRPNPGPNLCGLVSPPETDENVDNKIKY